MSNREDNLKKINAELEKLSDEELDNVAGSSLAETARDSKILYDHGLMDDYSYSDFSIIGIWLKRSAQVDAGWAKAGITSVTKPFGGNKYFKDGKEISRDDAIKIVKSKFKRIHDVSTE